ncbi:MAG: glycosyltransferase family 39 protein [Fimbriimonadales bacterium]|nr:glycosyltransferase family 39 protein [Fimbriimonadales bacterium]
MSRRRPREIHRQQGLLSDRWLRYAPWAVLTAHVLLAIAYNLATPFGNNGYTNTPDEGAHFQYVQFVAREWRLPLFEGYEGVGYEAHQPPLYYFLAAAFYHLSGGAGKGVRLLSTLCSAGVVWLVWLSLRRLAPERPLLALSGMSFAAFLPMHLAIGSAVGNDALTNLLFAAVLYGLLRALCPRSSDAASCGVGDGARGGAVASPPAQGTRRLQSESVLGLLLGLALITKATAILLLPVAALGVLWSARLQGQNVGQGLMRAGLTLGIALLLGGWWFVRNAILYDDPLLQKTFVQVFAGTAKAQDFLERGATWGQYLHLVADWTFRSFWFAYGTPATAATGLPNFLPDSVYWGLAGWTLMTLAGFLLSLREPIPSGARAWIVLCAVAFALVLVSFLLFIRIFFQAQGRYFYPALLPISVFLALGWERLFPQSRRAVAQLGWTLAMALLAIGCWRYLG